MKWKIKTIQEKTNVGEQLEKARVAKGLTRARVSAVYCIPQTFITAVEQNNFKSLPDTIFTKSMLKKYVKILGLPEDEYVDLWKEAQTHWGALENTTVTERDIKKAVKSYSKWTITPSFFQKGFAVILSVLLLAYIGVRVEAAIAPTDLEIFTPVDQITITESTIMVSGKTEPEVIVTINRFPVTVNEDGYFEEVVTLQAGMNVLEIEAAKKYRPAKIITRHILVTDSKEN